MIKVGEKYSEEVWRTTRAHAVRMESGFAGSFGPEQDTTFTPVDTPHERVQRLSHVASAVGRVFDITGQDFTGQEALFHVATGRPMIAVFQTKELTITYADHILLDDEVREVVMVSENYGVGALYIEPPIAEASEVICEEIIEQVGGYAIQGS